MTAKLPAIVAVAVLLATACGQVGDSVAVSIGSSEYTEDQLRSDLSAAVVDGTVPADATTAWLNNWVLFEAIGVELESRDITPTPEQFEAASAQITAADPTFSPDSPGSEVRIEHEAVRLAAVDWVLAEYPDAAPVELDADELPDMLCSRHVLLESEAAALDVIDRLDGGEAFADVAMEVSVDPGSNVNGGDLGCQLEGSFIPEFEDAAYAASDGEVVGPVQSVFGFHVIEVLSVGPATTEDHPGAGEATIEQAIQSRVDSLTQEAQAAVDARRNAWFGEIQEAAAERFRDRVEVSPEYGTWDAEQFLIVGPGR